MKHHSGVKTASDECKGVNLKNAMLDEKASITRPHILLTYFYEVSKTGKLETSNRLGVPGARGRSSSRKRVRTLEVLLKPSVLPAQLSMFPERLNGSE